jgi:predicted unusual protein kinase regulating ubiquinone biosynthesis (AarF/ABC1/UbiB family)
MLHADPHPGNFRIVPGLDGAPDRLGVLDYGAVARLAGGEMPRSLGRLMRIALLDDYDDVVRHLRDEGFIKPNIRVRAEDLKSYLGPFVDPARSETFQFSRDYMREQLQRLQDPSQPETQIAFRLNLPPQYLLIHRTFVGCVGVLCQLEARAPFRRLLEDWMPGFSDPI